MKAFVVDRFGKDGPRIADVPVPTLGGHDVLVRVSAASINPLDKMARDGKLKHLIKYKPPFVLGHDMAGVVTDVGADVRDFKVGDEVYARPRDLRIGTFAEFIAIDQDDVAPKPDSLTLEEAAAVPLVALQPGKSSSIEHTCGRVRRCSFTPEPAASARPSSSSPSTSAPLSRPLPAPPPQTSSGTSGPTSSSTTPSRTFPRCCRATTS